MSCGFTGGAEVEEADMTLDDILGQDNEDDDAMDEDEGEIVGLGGIAGATTAGGISIPAVARVGNSASAMEASGKKRAKAKARDDGPGSGQKRQKSSRANVKKHARASGDGSRTRRGSTVAGDLSDTSAVEEIGAAASENDDGASAGQATQTGRAATSVAASRLALRSGSKALRDNQKTLLITQPGNFLWVAIRFLIFARALRPIVWASSELRSVFLLAASWRQPGLVSSQKTGEAPLCGFTCSFVQVPKDPSEAVKYWMTKLRIESILEGTALGREIHQAGSLATKTFRLMS
jgi:hypothetical protein